MSEESENDAMNSDEEIAEIMLQVTALIVLLEQKGLVTRQELKDEVEGIKKRQA